MDDNNFYGAPAGWYPDPLGLPQLRWWDSTAWTHQVAEARAPMVIQETTYAWPEDELADEQELPTRRERREQERRDHIDIPVPTTLTLLELEPPSVNALQQPAALEQEPSQPTQQPLPDLLEPVLQEPVASVAQESIPAPFESLSASHATSLQDNAGLPATDTACEFDQHEFDQHEFDQPRTAQRAPSAPFDWNPQPEQADEKAQAQSWRSRFVRQQVPTPVAVTVPHKATHNFAVWTIALIPLAQLVVSLLVLTAIGSAVSSNVMAAIWLAPYPLVISLAALDRALLRRTGHENTAHWLWALLTAPIYLVVRAVATLRESGGGFGPVLVWVVLGLLHIASIAAVPGLLISALPAVFANQAEQSIISDAAVTGAKLEVACPAPAVLIGQSFTCNGTTAAGKSLDIEVSLQRVNGWIDWRVDDWGIYNVG